jgi:hypothetical protein
MITVFQDSGTWWIVRNLRLVDGSGISGSRQHSAARTRQDFECWTGKAWIHLRHVGLKFKSMEEAAEHLEANRAAIEAAN